MNTNLPPPSAPGGDPLAGLRAYRLPDPVSWWPPAPGWWVLALLLLVAGGVLAWWLMRRRRCNAAARHAHRELARLRHSLALNQDSAAFVRNLSKLLRRYVLTVFPHQDVAGLTGEAWLTFLDANGGDGRFASEPGCLLVEAPYRPAAPVPADQLAELVEDWIRRNGGACI